MWYYRTIRCSKMPTWRQRQLSDGVTPTPWTVIARALDSLTDRYYPTTFLFLTFAVSHGWWRPDIKKMGFWWHVDEILKVLEIKKVWKAFLYKTTWNIENRYHLTIFTPLVTSYYMLGMLTNVPNRYIFMLDLYIIIIIRLPFSLTEVPQSESDHL